MQRILADLSEDDVRWLDRLAASEGKSRAAVIRDAVGSYRESVQAGGIERYFGIWRDRAGESGE